MKHDNIQQIYSEWVCRPQDITVCALIGTLN